MSPLDLLIGRAEIEIYAQISITMKEERQLHPYIQQAQNLDIKEVIGNAFWTDLVTNRNEEKYQTLLAGGTYLNNSQETVSFMGLTAAIAAYSFARYVIGKNHQDTPFGFMTKDNQYGTPSDSKALSMLSGQHRSAGQQYLKECLEFLCVKNTDYPLFKKADANKSKSKGVIRMTGVSREY